jgi:hypothetical protein
VIPFWLVYGESSFAENGAPLECYAGYPKEKQAEDYASNFSGRVQIVAGVFTPNAEHHTRPEAKRKDVA